MKLFTGILVAVLAINKKYYLKLSWVLEIGKILGTFFNFLILRRKNEANTSSKA